MRKKSNAGFYYNLIAGFIGVALFFIIAETILRLVHFNYNFLSNVVTITKSGNATKKYFGNASVSSVDFNVELEPYFNGLAWDTWAVINSKGCRDREFAIQKNSNTTRIICMGDSSTFGIKVKNEDTYSKRLERILNNNKRLKNFEVLNFGCPGYTSFNGLMLLKKRLLPYRPDIIIIYYCWNDAFMWDWCSDAVSYRCRVLNRSFRTSRVFSFLWFMAAENMLKDNNKLVGKVAKSKLRVPPEEFKKNLKEIYKLLKKHKIKGLFVTYPFKEESIPLRDSCISATRMREYNEILRKSSKRYGFNLLDLDGIFRERYNNSWRLFADYCHPSYYGHSVIAAEIYKKLVEENLVECNTANPFSSALGLGHGSFLDILDKADIRKAPTGISPTLTGCPIGDDFRYCIFQHAPSEIICSIRVSSSLANLKFSIGLHPGSWSLEKGDGVQFEIDVDAGDGFRKVFSGYINPKDKPEDRKWHDYTIDLSEYIDREIKIAFKTLPGPMGDTNGDHALWAQPLKD